MELGLQVGLVAQIGRRNSRRQRRKQGFILFVKETHT